MDAYHREIILSNIDTLIEWTDYDQLKDGCISKNILSTNTFDEIEVNRMLVKWCFSIQFDDSIIVNGVNINLNDLR